MNSRESPLEGQVVMVTGGTHGVGRAVCDAMIAQSATVHACGRDPEQIAALGGIGVTAASVDIRVAREVTSWIEEVVRARGRVDILVNAAGVSLPAIIDLEDVEPDQWERIIDTNLTGTYNVCRAVLPHMKRRGSGRIINILSKGAYRIGGGSAPYFASKHGARALTEALVEETKGTGVLVSAVSPGPIDTNIWSHKSKPPSAQERARMLRPKDVAEAVVFVCERPRTVHIETIIVQPAGWS